MAEPEDRPEWNPGGWAAKRKGCTCSRLDNRFGEGRVIKVTVGDDPDKPLPDERFRTSQWESTMIDFDVNPTCPLHADTPHPSSDDLGSEGIVSSD